MNTQEIKSRKAEFIKAMQLKILSGDLKPGDRVPPERELAQSFGISRGSVSQGILDLERAAFCASFPAREPSLRSTSATQVRRPSAQ